MTAYIAIAAFVVAVAIGARVWPGKTENDLVFDDRESSLYQCHNLTIRRYSRMGRQVIWPKSKIHITNQRVIFAQKGLWSATYVIREIAVRKEHAPTRWKRSRFWGQVPIYELGEADFSIENQTDTSRIVFTNRYAPNLKRMEIAGVDSIERFMQAVALTDPPASTRPQ